MSGFLSSPRSWGAIEGKYEGDLIQADSLVRLAKAYETNAILQAEIRSNALVGKCFRKERSADFSLPWVANEKTKTHSLRFRLGRYGCTREAAIRFPQFLDVSPSAAALNSKLSSLAEGEIAEFFEDFWPLLKDSVRLPGASYDWSLETNYELHSLSLDLVSIRGQHYSYTGGAHGNTFYTGLNFFLKGDGAIAALEFETLFPASSQALEICSAHCIAELSEQGASDVVSGSLSSLDRDDLKTFTLDPHGMVFYFAPYHVGPYAQGMFQVRMPAGEIARYLNGGALGQAVLKLWALEPIASNGKPAN